MGQVILNTWINIDLVPFIRVARERSTARAKRYKNGKNELQQLLSRALAEAAPAIRGAMSSVFPFATWHVWIVVERKRRVDTTAEIEEARTLWNKTGKLFSLTFNRVRACLGQNGDGDNYGKTVLDAGTGILWFDDELVQTESVHVNRDVDSPRVHILAVVEVPS